MSNPKMQVYSDFVSALVVFEEEDLGSIVYTLLPFFFADVNIFLYI